MSVAYRVNKQYSLDNRFDGDQMNLILALDNDTAGQLENLAPHKSCLDLNRPRQLSSAASMPTPVASTIANWMHYKREPITDPHKFAFLQELAMA